MTTSAAAQPVSKVFIAFQDNEESRPVVEAVLADNPEATAAHTPGLVKIDCPRHLVIRRASIEARTGLKWTTDDTVKTILLGAMLGASGKEDRDPDGRLPPMSW